MKIAFLLAITGLALDALPISMTFACGSGYQGGSSIVSTGAVYGSVSTESGCALTFSPTRINFSASFAGASAGSGGFNGYIINGVSVGDIVSVYALFDLDPFGVAVGYLGASRILNENPRELQSVWRADTIGTYVLSQVNGAQTITMGLDSLSISHAPEPGTWFVVGAGLLAVGAIRRRHKPTEE